MILAGVPAIEFIIRTDIWRVELQGGEVINDFAVVGVANKTDPGVDVFCWAHIGREQGVVMCLPAIRSRVWFESIRSPVVRFQPFDLVTNFNV